MKKILILGKGYLGKALFESLTSKHYEVKIFSKKELDYTNLDNLASHLSSFTYDAVINCSGYTGRPNIDAALKERQLCWDLNVTVPFMIAMACYHAERGIPQFINFSSGCIYNGYDKEWTEEDIPNFGLYSTKSSYYSKTKHAAEIITQGLPGFHFRIRMPFDGTGSPRNLFNKLLGYDTLISEENSMTCIYDLFDFVADFILDLESRPWGVYNVVNDGSISAKKIIEILAKYGLSNSNHKFIELHKLQTLEKRSNCVLSTDKIAKMNLSLGPVEDAVERCARLLATRSGK